MTDDLSFNTLDKNQVIQEILQMRREIAHLQDQFGITLEPEVNLIGLNLQ